MSSKAMIDEFVSEPALALVGMSRTGKRFGNFAYRALLSKGYRVYPIHPFADEINPQSALYAGGYRRGFVAMANAGPNTNGSQFFILQEDYPLPPNYVIFARVTQGLEVVDALANTPTTMGPGGEVSQPVTPLTMKKVTIRP